MHVATRNNQLADRKARLQHAFVESAVASTSALVSLIATLYRFAPDALAHVHRVAQASRCISDRLALSHEQMRVIERAALVHDIGKIIVPDDPADRETEALAESAVRVRQVVAARDVLASAPFLRSAADIVGSLAERTDGSGWPLGLKGAEIPVGARVVGVADAFDALTVLCVEMVLSPEVIATELVRHAGTRFDPEVVAACLRWMDGAPLGVPVMQSQADQTA